MFVEGFYKVARILLEYIVIYYLVLVELKQINIVFIAKILFLIRLAFGASFGLNHCDLCIY